MTVDIISESYATVADSRQLSFKETFHRNLKASHHPLPHIFLLSGILLQTLSTIKDNGHLENYMQIWLVRCQVYDLVLPSTVYNLKKIDRTV